MEGGHVDAIKLNCSPELRVVIAIPDFPLTTKQARSVLPQTVQFGDAIYNTSRSSFLVAAIATGHLDALSIAMKDRLHQPYRAMLIPGFDDVVQAAIEAGALGVALSGAGPSIAAYCTQSAEQVAAHMRQAFAQNRIACEVKVLAIDTDGAIVRIEE
jgi:homoserine kinase